MEIDELTQSQEIIRENQGSFPEELKERLMRSPLVSVCIPTYNCASFLPEAIESVLNQTFTDYELLIRDNCSQDNTRELVESYAVNDERIIYTVNDENIGMAGNWNACLQDAKGKYIKYLCSDDILCSRDALRLMVAILDHDNTISIVASSRNLIDEGSKNIGQISLFEDGMVADGKGIIVECLLEPGNLIGEPSAVMFRKNQSLRGFNRKYMQLTDMEMWFHLLEQGNLAYIGEPLCSFRQHQNQQTKANLTGPILSDNLLLLSEYLDKSYVRLSYWTKQYLLYCQNYEYWKLCKKNVITLRTAMEKISLHYEPWLFMLLYPLFKLYRSVWKLKRYMKHCNGKVPA